MRRSLDYSRVRQRLRQLHGIVDPAVRDRAIERRDRLEHPVRGDRVRVDGEATVRVVQEEVDPAAVLDDRPKVVGAVVVRPSRVSVARFATCTIRRRRRGDRVAQISGTHSTATMLV